jgi:predicted secreted protein
MAPLKNISGFLQRPDIGKEGLGDPTVPGVGASMRTRVTTILVTLLALSGVTASYAGDVAAFKNLGFSPDSRYFQFAQYGIDAKTQNPWAETSIVDVIRNDFVTGGVSHSSFPVGVTLGDDGLKALFAHLDKVSADRRKWKLDYLDQGRPIYFRVTGEDSNQDYDNLKVLDYKTGRQYLVQVKKLITPNGTTVSSTYSIELEVKDRNGQSLGTYKVGSPNFIRSGVQNYTVIQMILSHNERSLVFVVEKEETDGQGGVSLRDMVETVTLAK